MKHAKHSKFFGLALVGVLGVSALIGALYFIFGDISKMKDGIFSNILVVALYSLTSLASFSLYQKNKSLIAIIGLIISGIGFVYFSGLTWGIIDRNLLADLWQTYLAYVLGVLAVVFAHTALMLQINQQKRPVRLAVRATLLCTLILTGLTLMIMWNVPIYNFDFSYRLFAVVTIGDVLGTICSPILSWVYGRSE